MRRVPITPVLTLVLVLGLLVALGGCANRLPTATDDGPAATAPTGGCNVIRTVTVKPPPGVSQSRSVPCRPRACTPTCSPTAHATVCPRPTVRVDGCDPCADGRCQVPR